MSTVTVLASPERRRRWTSAEKQRIVEESLTADTTVSEAAGTIFIRTCCISGVAKRAAERCSRAVLRLAKLSLRRLQL